MSSNEEFGPERVVNELVKVHEVLVAIHTVLLGENDGHNTPARNLLTRALEGGALCCCNPRGAPETTLSGAPDTAAP